MKICIELNEEMESLWTRIKSSLNFRFTHTYKMPVSLPDDVVFWGLLFGFENECIDFADQFTTEEVRAMIQKRMQLTFKEC